MCLLRCACSVCACCCWLDTYMHATCMRNIDEDGARIWIGMVDVVYGGHLLANDVTGLSTTHHTWMHHVHALDVGTCPRPCEHSHPEAYSNGVHIEGYIYASRGSSGGNAGNLAPRTARRMDGHNPARSMLPWYYYVQLTAIN